MTFYEFLLCYSTLLVYLKDIFNIIKLYYNDIQGEIEIVTDNATTAT